jgi:hypothetical protein
VDILPSLTSQPLDSTTVSVPVTTTVDPLPNRSQFAGLRETLAAAVLEPDGRTDLDNPTGDRQALET